MAFSFWGYLFVVDIFLFLQTRKVMTPQVVLLKQYNTQSRPTLEILKHCSWNLASEMYLKGETNDCLSYRFHENSYAASPVFIKTKFTRFYHKEGSSTRNHLMGRVKTMWEPPVFQERPSGPLRFSQKENVAKNVAMATLQQVSFCSFCDIHFWCQV